MDATAAFVDFIVALVLRRLRRHDASTYYATAPKDLWPPHAKSRRHARDLIRRVPAHEQIGLGRATQWRVPIVAFDAHYASTPKPTLRALGAIDEDAMADAALEAAGLRKTTRKTA